MKTTDGWVSQVAVAAAAKKVARILDAAAIPFVVVKGVVSAHDYYADVAERQVGDLDIRVPRAGVDAAVRALTRGGHPPVGRCFVYGTAGFDVDGVDLDLESSFGPPGLVDLSVEQVWQRRRILHVQGARLPAPDEDDHALVIAANVFKDKIDRAKAWAIRDAVIALTDRAGAGRADAFVRRVRDASATTLVYVVASTLRQSNPALTPLVEVLAPAARRRYASVYAAFQSSPGSLGMRLVARAASDNPRLAALALSAALGYELERRWGRYRG